MNATRRPSQQSNQSDRRFRAENHVAARRRRLCELEGHGHPTDFARELLDIFEQTLATRVADRDRLIGELASLKMHEIGPPSSREIARPPGTKSAPPLGQPAS